MIQILKDRNRIGAIKASPALITRIRFQYIAGLLFCIFGPSLLWYIESPSVYANPTVVNSLVGSVLAFTLAFFFVRQMGNFPGAKAGADTVFLVFLPYAVLAFAFLLLRIEYSRFSYFASFVASLAWIAVMQFVTASLVRPVITVVPGGHADELMSLTEIEWRPLNHPPSTTDGIAAVVADLREDMDASWQKFLARCTLAGKPVYHSKQLSESITGKVAIEHMSENSFGSLLPSLVYLNVKTLVDFVLALLLLPFILLISAVVVPLILVNSGWPVLFLQERIGFRGVPFRMYKFRTMRKPTATDARADSREAAMTRDDDSRIIPLGRFLRKYRIDELPQIINILKGEMSWIGPRPEAVSLAKWYETELAYYPYRHVVKPGISGWAQVNQGHVTSADQVQQKLHYDFFYIKHVSPWLDLLIVLKTVRTILFGFGAR